MLDSIMEKETLPVCDEDRAIPTKIAKLDTHIKYLRTQLAAMEFEISEREMDRKMLFARAKECNITTDDSYKIVEVPIYPKKKVDIELLKKNYEEKYNLILANKQSAFEDAMKAEKDKLALGITQADLKAVVKGKADLAMLIPPQKVPERYEVSVVKR